LLGNSSTVPQRLQRKTWMILGIVSLVAIAGGLILPRSFPAEPPTLVARSTPASEAKLLPAAPTAGTRGADVSAKGAEVSAKKEDLAYNPPPWPEAPDPKALLARLGVGTVVVLGLCVGTLWAAKRWLQGAAPVAASQQLRLLEALPLGNRCTLYLVSVGNRRVLVGADGGGLKTVAPLTEGFADALDEAACAAGGVEDPTQTIHPTVVG
jgi:flagellar biogenesis protein FliO